MNKRTLANMLLVVTHKHDQIFVQMAKKKNEGRCEEKLKLGKKEERKTKQPVVWSSGAQHFYSTQRHNDRKREREKTINLLF